MLTVTVKNEPAGIIKPMHAACEGPRTNGRYLTADATAIYKDIGVPFVRLHDIEYPYGSNQFVDIHCIFPDFSADENDERNYNFHPTDDYLKAIIDSGAEVYYRLGESIDHFENKFCVRPPSDFLKWARICEHIIMHYNYGWANGFYLGIKYWEIWNEPESRGMWRGTPRQFFELYAVAATYLKHRFPEIFIGGYSAAGVYTQTRVTNDPWFQTLVPFMNNFFDYIEGKNVPLDFFSWHCYAESPEEIERAAKFVRKYLNGRGYKKTQSHLTEYNTYYSLFHSPVRHIEYAADLLAGLITANGSPMDMCFYYTLMKGAYSFMNGVFGYDTVNDKPVTYPGYFSMKFYGDIFRLKTGIATDYEKKKGLYVLAAGNGKKTGIAVADIGYEGEALLNFESGETLNAVITAVSGEGEVKESKAVLQDGKTVLKLQKNYIYYVSLTR